jgi:general secretion pathway protein D
MKPNHLLQYVLFYFSISIFSGRVWAEPEVNIELQNVDIKQFIDAVAKITEKNFILDPSVNGQVTVVLHEPIEKDQLYDLFLAVLNVHGYSASEIGHSIKIVPKIDAKPIDSVAIENDIPSGNARETKVLYAKHIPVSQLLRTLQPLIASDAHLASIDAGNAIIVTDTASNIRRLEKIMSELDRKKSNYTVLVNLKFANAEQLLPTVNEYNQAQGEVVATTIVAEPVSNSLVLSGEKIRIEELERLIQQLDLSSFKLSTPEKTQVVYLQFTQAAELAPLISRMLIKEDTSVSPVLVDSDQNINAIILKAKEKDIKAAVALIKTLDVRRAQVLVEVIIAEVSTTKAAELGFQWAMGNGDAIGVSSFDGSGPNIVELRSDPQSLGSGLSLGLGQFINNGFGFGALLRALAKDAHTNIISTPSILTLDNQEAEIVVGQNVPFVTGKYSNSESGSGSGAPFQTIKRQDVGLSLKIKPQVGTSGAIKLDIEQEISSINQQSNSATDIITNKRSIKTQVMASHNDLIILGGLIDDSLQETTEKVPVLGDLPFVGAAFKYRKSQLVKRNLMVFIKPTIIMDEAISGQISLDKYKSIRDMQAKDNSPIPLLSDVARPILDNMDDVSPLKDEKASELEKNLNSVDW